MLSSTGQTKGTAEHEQRRTLGVEFRADLCAERLVEQPG